MSCDVMHVWTRAWGAATNAVRDGEPCDCGGMTWPDSTPSEVCCDCESLRARLQASEARVRELETVNRNWQIKCDNLLNMLHPPPAEEGQDMTPERQRELKEKAERWCPLCNRRTVIAFDTDPPFVARKCGRCGFVHDIKDAK